MKQVKLIFEVDIGDEWDDDISHDHNDWQDYCEVSYFDIEEFKLIGVKVENKK